MINNPIPIFRAFFIALSLVLLSGNFSTTFAGCADGPWIPGTNQQFGCMASNGCTSLEGGSGIVQTICSGGGSDAMASRRYSMNTTGPGDICQCEGEIPGVINNLIVLHPSATTEDVRYTDIELSCENGQKGVSVLDGSSVNINSTNWVCDGNGGHLEFTANERDSTEIHIAIDNTVAPHYQCDWAIDNSTQTGSDPTDDNVCSIIFNSGEENWHNGIIVRLRAPALPPPILPCPFNLQYQCNSLTREVTLSWEAIPGAHRYGVYINNLEDGNWPNSGTDYWDWPKPITPTSDIYDIRLNEEYSWNVQATSEGQSGNSGACAINSATFICSGTNTPPQATCDEQCDPDIANYCGTNNGRVCHDTDPQLPENHPDKYKCRLATNPTNTQCLGPVCGNGTEEGTENCDDGNTNNNDSCSYPTCQPQTQISGQIFIGDGNYLNIGQGGASRCVAAGGRVPLAKENVEIRIAGPGVGNRLVETDAQGRFTTWVPVGTSFLTADSPDIVNFNSTNHVIDCANTLTIARNEANVDFYYTVQGPSTGAWYQTIGGFIYSAGALNNPNMPTNSFLSLRLLAPLNLTASIPWSGNTINLQNGLYTQRDGSAQNQRVMNSTQSQTIEGYSYYYQKLNAQNSPVIATGETATITQKPTNCGAFDTTTGASVCRVDADETVLDLSQTWQMGSASTDKMVIFIDGNLTIRDTDSIRALTNVARGGFLAFIVNGTITIDPSVGNPGTQNTVNLQGVFIGNSIIIPPDPDGKRFIGHGSYISTSGSIMLRRTLPTANSTTPAESFRYRPDFALNAPEGLKNFNLQYEEVN